MWPIRLHIHLLIQLVIQLYSIQSITTDFNMGHKKVDFMKRHSKFDYLNQKRPLWVLEDEVQSTERDINDITFTTTDEPNSSNSYTKYRQYKILPEFRFLKKSKIQNSEIAAKASKRLQLPKHYISSERENYNRYYETMTPKPMPPAWRRQQPLRIPIIQSSYTPSMPIFDSVPSDINASTDYADNDDGMLAPIFIYNGPKGELIMNTMLSAHKYQMQEPIPGEILYPPTEPIFRPKPIIQSFRVNGRAEPLNLTLIPFYAHEAIVPHFMYDSYSKAATGSSSFKAVETTAATTATSAAATTAASRTPAVFYAASAMPVTTTSTTTTTLKPAKKRRHKKAKKYAVYRSADEVHWRPTEPSIFSVSKATTSFPMVLANPLQNHRSSLLDNELYDVYDEVRKTKTASIPMTTSTTTTKPMNNFKLTYKDEDSQFQIVYIDESIENPLIKENSPTKAAITRSPRLSTPKTLPLLSSHYSMNKEYYAFPVYTLGKLLKPDNTERQLNSASQFTSNYRNVKPKSENDVDTWFIMNSRYKGQSLNDGVKKLSSKYVEFNPAYATLSTEQIPETTIEKAII